MMIARPFSLCAAYLTATLVLLGSTVQAADVTLTGVDAFGASSFNSAGLWDSAATPSAGNDYFVGDGTRLRSPADGNSYTFAGDSLTINNTTEYGDGFMYKGTGNTGVLTVGNLILDGGLLSHAQGTTDVFQLDGGITVNSTSRIYAKQGNIALLSDISGAGDLSILATDDNADTTIRLVTLYGDNSSYTGNIDVSGKLVTADTSIMMFDIGASGVNNYISGTGYGTFEGVFSFDLTGASSNSGDSWTITDVATQTYGETFSVDGFAQSGSFWSDGTYLFDPTTGVLSVAEAPVEWNTDVNNSYFSVGTNWTGGTAPATGDNALFGSVITGNRTVLLDNNISLNRVTFSNTDGDYFLSSEAGQTLTLTGETAIDTAAGRHWIQVEVAGTEGLQKAGTGELILDHANSFSGTITVNEGRLSITHTDAISSGQDVNLLSTSSNLLFGGDNGWFVENGSTGGGYVNGTVSGVISGDGTVNVSLGATATFTGANTFGGLLTLEGTDTVLTLTGSGTPGASDGTSATQTRIGDTAQIALVNKAVGNEVLKLNERAGTGTPAHLTSSGTSSWAGNIVADTPGDGSHYIIESTSGTLTLSGVLSAYDAPEPNDRYFVFDGAGNINVTGQITDYATDANGDFIDLDLNGIPDSSAGVNVNVVKRGTGTLTINTASPNNYDSWFGTTTIEQGTLAVTAAASDDNELFSPLTTIKSGATLNVSSFTTYDMGPGDALAGGGTVNVGSGTFAIYDDNTISPGDGVGTLTFSGKVLLDTFDGSGAYIYQLGNSNATVGGTENDLIAITGSLTGSSAASFNIEAVEGSLQSGTYRLMTHSGGTPSFTGTVQAVDAEGNPLTIRQSLSVSATTSQVNLLVSGSAASLTWNGGSSTNTWNVATTSNWLNGSSSSDFRDLDNVTFGSAGTKSVVLDSTVTPGSTTFNSASTYTFTGEGGISGYGAVNVNAGTVKLYNTGNNIQGTTTVASGATLEMVAASTGDMTVNGTLALGKEVTTTLIDDFTSGLGSYTNTVMLDTDTAGGANTAAWQITGEVAEYNTSTYQSIEQAALIRNSLSLAVGEEIQVDVTHSGDSQDVGLYVGGTAPVAGTRQDYIAVYARNNGQVFSRGFDGTGEFALAGGDSPAYESLFIARTGENTYETGYYSESGRVVIATRTPSTANEGDVVGFYTDVRAAGVLGTLDNLRLVELGGTAALDIDGDFTLGATGTVELDITSSGYDSLDITGIATLDGVITVSLDDDYTPTDGTQFTILSAAEGIVTALGSIDFGTALPNGFTASLSDSLTDLILTYSAGLGGDFNGDGIVDLADYTVWRNNLGNADESVLANNGDGLNGVDVGDYNLWKTNFGTGSGGLDALSSSQTSVPEPQSLALLALMLAGGLAFVKK